MTTLRDILMQANNECYYHYREARILKTSYGIDFENAARSKANVRKLEQLLSATLPTQEAASPTCPFLTIAEQAAINILQTRLVLKHKTSAFNKELPTDESITLLSGKDQVLQCITQVKPSRSGRIFLSIGSDTHESPLFLNHTPALVITIPNAVITQEHYLAPFWLSPHLGDMIKSADFGKIHFMNSAKRMFYRYNKHQNVFPNGFKTYHYYHNNQLVLERTVPILDECVTGLDIIPFLLRQFILELRYLGKEYRLHVLNNLFNTPILNAAFDNIINTDSFEVSKPGWLHLVKSQCLLSKQTIWPVLDNDHLLQLPCNKYASLFRKGEKLTVSMIEKAAQDGHQLFITKLLKRGMPANACFLTKANDTDMCGLLHLVTKYKQSQLLNVLIEKNVDVRLRDLKRRNIAHYALMQGTVNDLRYILSLRTKYSYDHNITFAPNLNSHVYSLIDHPLYLLTRRGASISDVQHLFQLGLRIDGTFGCMCLFILLSSDIPLTLELENTIQQLINAGVEINFRIAGMTPLMVAAQKRASKIVEILINNGAKIDLRSYQHGQRHPNGLLGKTALMLAAEVPHNHLVITQLLKAGADASLYTHENRCAADYAIDPDYFPDATNKRRKLVRESAKPAVEEIGSGVACVMGFDNGGSRYYCLGKRVKPIGQLFFPGGYFDIEQDCHLKDTATRELCEETNLALKPVKDEPIYKSTRQMEKFRHDTEFYFFNAGNIQHASLFDNSDLISIAWVPEPLILNRTVNVHESNLFLIQSIAYANRMPKPFPDHFFHHPNHITPEQVATLVDAQIPCDYQDQQTEKKSL